MIRCRLARYLYLNIHSVDAKDQSSHSVSNIHQSSTIGAFSHSVEAADMEDIKAAKKEAQEYNASLYQKQQKESFRYTGSKATDSTYEHILNLSGDSVMGYISIPKINVDIPIRHGTTEEVLEEGAGHIYGTSVPIGGANTHTVISAHTGLESAKLFTDIDKLKEGDYFSIHSLNEVHYYLVDKIRIVLPQDADQYLQIEPGKDLATLYTCTPYGINTHRLLVRGHAISAKEFSRISSHKGNKQLSIKSVNRNAIVKSIILGAIPVLTLVIGLILTFKPRRKKV